MLARLQRLRQLVIYCYCGHLEAARLRFFFLSLLLPSKLASLPSCGRQRKADGVEPSGAQINSQIRQPATALAKTAPQLTWT